MLETYNVNSLATNLSNIVIKIMQGMFSFVIIIVTIWIIFSLLIWLFGATKQSEKLIGFGIKNSIVTISLGIVTLLIPVIVKFMK